MKKRTENMTLEELIELKFNEEKEYRETRMKEEEREEYQMILYYVMDELHNSAQEEITFHATPRSVFMEKFRVKDGQEYRDYQEINVTWDILEKFIGKLVEMKKAEMKDDVAWMRVRFFI